MKARVKATGEIVDVKVDDSQFADYIGKNGLLYWKGELDFEVTDKDAIYNKGWQDGWDEAVKSEIPKIHPKIKGSDPDYWEKLKHQYAGMAMQGLLNNSLLAGELKKDPNNGIAEMSNTITKAAVVYATALVERLKSESNGN